MKITRIIQQANRQGRYSLFVDGVYGFSLSESALLESKLAVGSELAVTDLKHWKQESADDNLTSRALKYAMQRTRSTWEMEQYLKRKDASPALTKKILNKLSDIRVLDDQVFARVWVANRRLLRPTSKRKLQQELRAKRVSAEVIDSTLGSEQKDDLIVLRELVAKKRELPKYRADPLKFMQYLARQGFRYGDIKEVMQRVED